MLFHLKCDMKTKVSEKVQDLRENKEKWLKFVLSILKKCYPRTPYPELVKKAQRDEIHIWTCLYKHLHDEEDLVKSLGGIENVKGFCGELKSLLLKNPKTALRIAQQKEKEEKKKKEESSTTTIKYRVYRVRVKEQRGQILRFFKKKPQELLKNIVGEVSKWLNENLDWNALFQANPQITNKDQVLVAFIQELGKELQKIRNVAHLRESAGFLTPSVVQSLLIEVSPYVEDDTETRNWVVQALSYVRSLDLDLSEEEREKLNEIYQVAKRILQMVHRSRNKAMKKKEDEVSASEKT